MEQQKLLWIIFALATGFLVVVAAAFVLFVPPTEAGLNQQETAAVDSDAFDVTDYLKNGEEQLALEDEPDNSGETSFVIGVQEPEGEPNSVESVGETPKESVEPAAAVPVAKPAPEPVPVPVIPKAEPKKVRVTEYWIQTGSFTKRSSAELARENLKSREFDSVIFTKTVEGTEYFRVRIGPYRYKAEAEKFLGYVKNIDNFNLSQIYEVYVEKTL